MSLWGRWWILCPCPWNGQPPARKDQFRTEGRNSTGQLQIVSTLWMSSDTLHPHTCPAFFFSLNSPFQVTKPVAPFRRMGQQSSLKKWMWEGLMATSIGTGLCRVERWLPPVRQVAVLNNDCKPNYWKTQCSNWSSFLYDTFFLPIVLNDEDSYLNSGRPTGPKKSLPNMLILCSRSAPRSEHWCQICRRTTTSMQLQWRIFSE